MATASSISFPQLISSHRLLEPGALSFIRRGTTRTRRFDEGLAPGALSFIRPCTHVGEYAAAEVDRMSPIAFPTSHAEPLPTVAPIWILSGQVCVLFYEDSTPHVPQHPWRLAVGAIPTRCWEPNGTKEFVDVVEHLDIQ